MGALEPYHHKTKPTLYAYRKGCHCAGCRAVNTASVRAYNADLKAKRDAAKAAPMARATIGPVERSVLARFEGMADIPWQETWKLLALFHAHTIDIIDAQPDGPRHLAGTAHAKLADCMDRLRPPTPPPAQAVKQGITDLESFANDL